MRERKGLFRRTIDKIRERFREPSWEEIKREHFRPYYLDVSFRHVRGAEQTMDRIYTLLFPEINRIQNSAKSYEAYKNSPNKEEILSSWAIGIDYSTDRLLRLIEKHGCHYVGSNGTCGDYDRDD